MTGPEGRSKTCTTISTLPKDLRGTNNSAELEVHPNGRFLYASNRGHDSIAVFAIDPRAKTRTLVEHVATQGKMPRNFAIDPTGAYLLAANPTGDDLKTPVPVCLIFLQAQ